MFNKKSKISKVIWEDDDKTLMKIVFQDSPDVALESVNSVSWLAKKAKKQFSVEDITEATTDHYDKLGQETILFDRFKDDYWEFQEWKKEKKNSKTRIDVLNYILNISDNKEDFFKLKLQIFELDEVKKSTNREWKAKLRKAQSSLELLAFLHQELPDLGNAPTSPDDETPLQDVTNQPNSDDLNPQQVSESSDSANE
jgi:hypothetical protein